MGSVNRKATAADFKAGAEITDAGGNSFTIMRPAAGVAGAWEARGNSGDKVVFENEALCYTLKPQRGGARTGAGRKATGSALVAITPRISPVAADWLHKLASRHGSSQAQVIEHLILMAETLPETLTTARK